jgi:hypothetical protein
MLGRIFNRQTPDQPADAAMAPTQETPPPAPVEITMEKIAQRAYEKWCERGRPEGSAERDWLEAEAELRAEAEGGQPESADVKKSR